MSRIRRRAEADGPGGAPRRSREAAAELAPLTRAAKDAALHAMADALDDATTTSSPPTPATSRPAARPGWPTA